MITKNNSRILFTFPLCSDSSFTLTENCSNKLVFFVDVLPYFTFQFYSLFFLLFHSPTNLHLLSQFSDSYSLTIGNFGEKTFVVASTCELFLLFTLFENSFHFQTTESERRKIIDKGILTIFNSCSSFNQKLKYQ